MQRSQLFAGTSKLYCMSAKFSYITFSRRFYPLRLIVHSGYIVVLSVCVFPGNRTHNLCAANAMLYHWATGNTPKCEPHWPNVWNMCAHTILWDDGTHCNIGHTLAWRVSCGSVSNEIATTSLAFGQIEPGLVHKNKNVFLTPWFSTKKQNKVHFYSRVQ